MIEFEKNTEDFKSKKFLDFYIAEILNIFKIRNIFKDYKNCTR